MRAACARRMPGSTEIAGRIPVHPALLSRRESP
jgi:hypothetical protein